MLKTFLFPCFLCKASTNCVFKLLDNRDETLLKAEEQYLLLSVEKYAVSLQPNLKRPSRRTNFNMYMLSIKISTVGMKP